MSEAPNYHPEAVAEAIKMPIEGLRVLRELMDAAQAKDPLSFLVRAHRELESYIEVVRESYINRASGILATAGAGADLQVSQPFPQHGPQQQQAPQPKATATGFQRNKEES